MYVIFSHWFAVFALAKCMRTLRFSNPGAGHTNELPTALNKASIFDKRVKATSLSRANQESRNTDQAKIPLSNAKPSTVQQLRFF